MNLKRVVWLFAIIAVSGQAYAQTSSCPKPADIKHSRMDIGGFSYVADGPLDQKWTGQNEHAEEANMESLVFKEASYKARDDGVNSMSSVFCDYHGSGSFAVRLVLKPVHDFDRAADTLWKDNHCKDNDRLKCSFNHQ